MAPMEIGILGPTELRDDGGSVALGGARVRMLLAALALRPGQVVAAGRLIDDLWGASPPAEAANALQTLVSRLRKALGRGGLVESRPPGYLLAVDPEAVDAVRFERLAAAGRRALAQGDPGAAAAGLRRALALWRGPALADLGGASFAQAAAARLEDLRVQALEDRIEADLALGEGAALVPELEALVAEHPLRERPRGQLMRALYRAGRQADALALYEATRRALAAELGADPGPDLRRLHLAMLRQDPSLEAPTAAGAPAAPGAPPPAAAPGAPESNLPAQLSSFVGREEDVVRVGKLLGEARLVTLTGPGGAGKTRLACESAARLGRSGSWPDGAWLVELGSLHDPAALPQVVLAALGMRETRLLGGGPQASAPEPLDRLLAALKGKRLLLLLDNCEHLVDAAARLARQILAACPGVRVLATSREPLGVTGEALWPVRPLPVPPPGDLEPAAALGYPAVRLLVDRAAAARPGFSLNAGNVAAVAEICRRLDGIPLAIELAAARLRSLTVEQLAARLDDRFRLLVRGDRSALPRQQTLRAVVDWSWQLLDDPERVLLRRLAVFSGGCTLAAAEQVCARALAAPGISRLDPDGVLDLLAALVDKSLLVAAAGPGGEPRYRMLETIHAYVAERLQEAGEAERVRGAHAAWAVRLAEWGDRELRGAGQLEAIQRLEAEHDNLRAALRWLIDSGQARRAQRLAGALAWFWQLRDHHAEGKTWLVEAVALGGADRGLARARALGFRSLFGLDGAPGTTSAAIDAGRQALALYATAGGHHTMAVLFPAMLTFIGGQRAEGLRLLDEGVAACRAAGDDWGLAIALLMRGRLRLDEQGPAAAEPDIRAGLEGFRALGDHWGQIMTLAALGDADMMRGEYRRAAGWLQDALAQTALLGVHEDVPYLVIRTGDALELAGDAAAARSRYLEGIELARRYGVDDMIAFAQAALGRSARRRGDLAQARERYQRALELIRAGLAIPQLEATVASGLGFLAELEGDAEGALALHRRALEVVRRSGDRPVMALAVEGLAGVAALTGQPERAAVLLGAAAALRPAPLAPGERDDVDRIAAAARAALGDERFEAARRRGAAMTVEQALECADELPAQVRLR
jgi:predicted ATPase/DNA-binding SARP family transcriptional activator